MTGWMFSELRLASSLWNAGLCARCIAIVLKESGYPARTTRAIRACAAKHREEFPVRDPFRGASNRGRGRAAAMREGAQ